MDKNKAFLQGDKVRMRELQKEFRRKAKLAKIRYKDVVEKKTDIRKCKRGMAGLKHYYEQSNQIYSG